MIKIALTGSIGMGKSTVAAMFAGAGIPVFDADAEVRVMQSPGGELVPAIDALFPGTVRDGMVDRERLAEEVLADRDKLAQLETLVHPRVAEKRQRFIDANLQAPALLFDIPLLFETHGENAFDTVIVVSAPADIQRERVLARPDMHPAKFEAILSRQMADEQKRERADFIVDTGGPLEETRAQVADILACLGLTAER